MRPSDCKTQGDFMRLLDGCDGLISMNEDDRLLVQLRVACEYLSWQQGEIKMLEDEIKISRDLVARFTGLKELEE